MKSKKAARLTSKRRAPSREDAGMVTVQNVNVPGYVSRVNAIKYTAMRQVLLLVLPSSAPGMTQAEMFAAVKQHVPQDLFPAGAKSGWWAKTVQLDLEEKGLVRRSAEMKPLRWYRTKKTR